MAVPIGASTHNAALSSAVTLNVPDNADWIILSAQTNSVRVTIDGTTPTASLGIVITTNAPVILPVESGGSVKVIESTASAAIDYQFLAD